MSAQGLADRQTHGQIGAARGGIEIVPVGMPSLECLVGMQLRSSGEETMPWHRTIPGIINSDKQQTTTLVGDLLRLLWGDILRGSESKPGELHREVPADGPSYEMNPLPISKAMQPETPRTRSIRVTLILVSNHPAPGSPQLADALQGFSSRGRA